jgi:hypothetical protein
MFRRAPGSRGCVVIAALALVVGSPAFFLDTEPAK